MENRRSHCSPGPDPSGWESASHPAPARHIPSPGSTVPGPCLPRQSRTASSKSFSDRIPGGIYSDLFLEIRQHHRVHMGIHKTGNHAPGLSESVNLPLPVRKLLSGSYPDNFSRPPAIMASAQGRRPSEVKILPLIKICTIRHSFLSRSFIFYDNRSTARLSGNFPQKPGNSLHRFFGKSSKIGIIIHLIILT